MLQTITPYHWYDTKDYWKVSFQKTGECKENGSGKNIYGVFPNFTKRVGEKNVEYKAASN